MKQCGPSINYRASCHIDTSIGVRIHNSQHRDGVLIHNLINNAHGTRAKDNGLNHLLNPLQGWQVQCKYSLIKPDSPSHPCLHAANNINGLADH